MKNIILLIIGIILLSCNQQEEIYSSLGKQYYRIVQYDIDGKNEIFYYNKVVENNKQIKNSRIEDEIITCETEGIQLQVTNNFIWITIQNEYHNGIIIVNGISIDPNYCTSTDCTWKLSSDIYEFTSNEITYTWTEDSGKCFLPIELQDFIITSNEDGTNTITIITASEINADYMLIERSKDFINWQLVEEVQLENNIDGSTYIVIDKGN